MNFPEICKITTKKPELQLKEYVKYINNRERKIFMD